MILRSNNNPGNGGASEHDAVRSKQMGRLLRSHFDWVDKDVSCETARLFLPSMTCGSLNVRVPTPITVHLDHCAGCRGDFERLTAL